MKYQTIIAIFTVALLAISCASHQVNEPCKILDAKFYPHSATDYSYRIKFNTLGNQLDRIKLVEQLFRNQVPACSDYTIIIKEYAFKVPFVYPYDIKVYRRLPLIVTDKLSTDSTQFSK